MSCATKRYSLHPNRQNSLRFPILNNLFFCLRTQLPMHTNERLIAQRGQKFKLTSLSPKARRNPNFTRDLKEHPKHPKWGVGGWNWAQSQLSSMKKSKSSQLSSNCSKKLFSNCRQNWKKQFQNLAPSSCFLEGLLANCILQGVLYNGH